MFLLLEVRIQLGFFKHSKSPKTFSLLCKCNMYPNPHDSPPNTKLKPKRNRVIHPPRGVSESITLFDTRGAGVVNAKGRSSVR